MMHETLFRETFSQLRASDEAKREVLSMIETRQNRQTRRIGRVVGLAAALIAALAGQKLDITDELEETGSFRRTFTLEEPQSDGTSIEHSCTVTVTGSLASWTAIWDYGGGVTYTAAGGRD